MLGAKVARLILTSFLWYIPAQTKAVAHLKMPSRIPQVKENILVISILLRSSYRHTKIF
jgi:hypothetical protein